MSLAVTGTVIGIVGGVASVYSAYEAGEERERQYEAAQAAFANDVDAAITNGKWKMADDKVSYLLDNQKSNAVYNVAVDSITENVNIQSDYKQSATTLNNLLKAELSEADINKLKNDSLSSLANMADSAALDAEYAVAMANNSTSFTSAKAVIDATSYMEAARAAATFMDQDVITIKEGLNRANEDIADMNNIEVGKVLSKYSNNVTAGNSVVRQIQDRAIKVDKLKAKTMLEGESAIAKIYNNQKKTVTEASSRATNILNTSIASNAKAISDAIYSVEKGLSKSKVDINKVMSDAISAQDHIVNTTVTSIDYASSLTDADISANESKLSQDLVDMESKKALDDSFKEATYLDEQRKTGRGVQKSLETYSTQISSAGAKTKELEFLTSETGLEYYENNEEVVTSNMIG